MRQTPRGPHYRGKGRRVEGGGVEKRAGGARRRRGDASVWDRVLDSGQGSGG